MLILVRKAEQGIVITMPNGVEVTYRILAVEGERVKVGITAPQDVQILREELLPDFEERVQRPKPEGRQNPLERL